MSEHSTGYIFRFATMVCLACSVVVSGSAVMLESRISENKVLDRQRKVLTVAGLMEDGDDLAPADVTGLFSGNIKARIVDLSTGDYVDGIDVANFDQRKASKDPKQSKEAPANAAQVLRIPTNAVVYHVMRGKEIDKVILPVEGKGLWSTLYGFLALETDLRTVAGLTFYEHGETPGLGGEVDNPAWKALWKGRKAFGEGKDAKTPKIEVIKGAAGAPGVDPYHVDGLSGATITSRGVTYLVHFWLGEHGFGPYLAKFAASQGGK